MKEVFDVFPTLLGLGGTHEILGFAGITEADKTAYVNTNYATAETAGKKYNMNPVVILAQGAMESAWGTSYMAKNIFNFFGITAGGKANEYWNGDFYVSKSSGLKFRKYKSTLDCFYDFARLISTATYYKAAHAASFSIPDYAREISNSPYAEQDPKSRAIYRKAVVSNAAYILKVRGQASASAALTAEASKITIPSSNETTTKPPTPPASTPTADQDNTSESNTGLWVALGVTAAAAIMVFTIPVNNKKLAT